MGMVLELRQVSNDQIDWLLANPELVTWFLLGPSTRPKPGFWSQLFGRRHREVSTKDEPWKPPADDEYLDLDKAWHGIHYLLNFSAWEGKEPFCYLVIGGKTLGDADLGYGPARALRSGQVRRFRDVVASLGTAGLAARYDPNEMADEDIYPSIWHGDPEADALGYLKEHFERLLEFLDRCVERNQGLIIYLS